MRALYLHTNEALPSSAGATRSLLSSDQGATFALDNATGSIVTLPKSVGDGGRYSFVVTVLATSNSHIIKVANTNDVISGVVHTTGTSGSSSGWATNATSDTITLNRTTTGSVTIGEWLEVVDAVSGTFTVRGQTTNTGTGATPFSATV